MADEQVELSDEQLQRLARFIEAERLPNGWHYASIICGVIGVGFGLIPLTFVVAWSLGAAAVICGFIAWKRAKAHGVKRGRLGFVLGCIAIALGGLGYAIVVDAFDTLEEELENIQLDEP